ncbi:MAG: hypothetical protein FWC19_06385 [Treponema sp.]|nr:hypothetical protein [Treponema sp.]
MDNKNQKVLIGDDSMIFTGDPSDTEFSGDGVKTIAELVAVEKLEKTANHYMCIITAAADEDSIFPGGLAVGKLYPASGAEVPETGDKFQILKLSHVADASSWSLSITQGEIDVTRLNDKFRKYRLGKKDAQLSLSSIFTVGESDQVGGAINRSMQLVIKKKDGTFIVSDEANRSLFILGFVNRAAMPEESDDFVFANIYLYNVRLGGQSGSAQSYDASGRLTGMDPVFYSLEAQEA